MWEPAKSAILDLTELAPDAPEVTELIAAVSAGQAKSRTAAHAEATPVMEEAPVAFAPMKSRNRLSLSHRPRPRKSHCQAAPVLELENVLDIPEAAQGEAAQIFHHRRQRPRAQSTEDILSDFVLDLEQSDLADFAPKQPSKAPAPAASAAAPAMERRSNGDMQDAESANVLSDILSELREETAEAAEPEEDPETHYNLGIAFKEMGLLDEAIGELQKVCHAVDRGAPFSQPIQALTWLAQCLVDKGAPEAAVRWYQKALHLPGLDDGSRCAIYYDLAAAYQASGDNKSALANFMEVYGSNIDFRDVASRIKALKS